MFSLPNSAPDSFTPKNWNLLTAVAQRELVGAGAVEVCEGGGEGDDDGADEGEDGVAGGVVAVDGWHWK